MNAAASHAMLVDLEVAIRSLQAIAWRLREASKEELATATVRPPVVAPAVAREPAVPKRQSMTYALGDEKLTVAQLARRAGCSAATMYGRLLNYTAAEALAKGGPSWQRPRKAEAAPPPAPKAPPAPKPPPPPRGPRSDAKRYAYRGGEQTCQQLADLAGVGYQTMSSRLAKAGMSPEQAVDAGDGRSTRPARIITALPPSPSAGTVIRPTEGPLVAPGVVAITPPGVEPIRAPTPPGRFDPTPEQPAQKIFRGRIGQYDETGTALSRAMRERGHG